MDDLDIRSIRLLVIGEELDWVPTNKGLKNKILNTKPSYHAFVFKILRKDLR